MRISSFETAADFKPYVLQLEVQTKAEANFLGSLMSANHTVPRELFNNGYIREEQMEELGCIMQEILDGINRAEKAAGNQ